MDRNKSRTIIYCVFIAVCCIMAWFLLTSSFIRLREDGGYEALPAINPEAGIGRDMDVTLYFRLNEEPALVPINRTITVKANEDVAAAVVRQLIEGPPAFSNDLMPVIPGDTRLIDVTMEGSILYVTVSREFLNVVGAPNRREDMNLAYRLAVYGVINSLTSLDGINRVQILVDTENSGIGTRMPATLLGFEQTSLLEPMRFEESVVITPERLVEFLLTHIMNEEYTQAYQLFAESESGGLQKPSFADFETEIHQAGKLLSFTIQEQTISDDAREATVMIDLMWQNGQSGQENASRATLQLLPEGGLYKLGYTSLMSILNE